MKHKIRGASHLALIATLAMTLGFSTLTLAGASTWPGDVGNGMGDVCAGTIWDCDDCANLKCNEVYPVDPVTGQHGSSYNLCYYCARGACNRLFHCVQSTTTPD